MCYTAPSLVSSHPSLNRFAPDEEPEEKDLTLEQLDEKAQAGDARAQTQVRH